MDMRQLAHQWANGDVTRQLGNVWARGDVFGYYATVLASWHDTPRGRVFLVSNQSFPTRTGRPRSAAVNASIAPFHVPFVVAGRNGRAVACGTVDELHALNVASYVQRMRDAFDKAARAVTQARFYATEAVRHGAHAWRYVDAFDLPTALVTDACADEAEAEMIAHFVGAHRPNVDCSAFWPNDVRRAVAASDARTARASRPRAAHSVTVVTEDMRAEWRAGTRRTLPHDHGPTMLRDRADLRAVETSRGAFVPLHSAHSLFTAWATGQAVPGIGVGDFTVRAVYADRIVIGCHELTRAECDAFAASRGWIAEVSHA